MVKNVPSIGEPIQMGGLDFFVSRVTDGVRPLVIGKDNHNVRTLLGKGREKDD